jgi:predicted phosphoribosyltransferase
MPFRNRSEAGGKLAEALAKYKDQRPVILALPRGGVPVAAEIAAALDAPLDLVLVRKIGVPFQPELAMGAVVDGGTHRLLSGTMKSSGSRVSMRRSSRRFASGKSRKSSGAASSIWAAANELTSRAVP